MSRRGKPAVVVSAEDWHRLRAKAKAAGLRAHLTDLPNRGADDAELFSRMPGLPRAIDLKVYLLDTGILSMLRRPTRAPMVAAWLDGVSDEDIWFSAITVGEIARGIALQRPRDPVFAHDLEAWLDTLLVVYGDRILSFGAAEAATWGQLSANIGNVSADLTIAATALCRDLTIVTRNTRHYTETGVRILDPAA